MVEPKNPIVGSLAGCCARAASGHAAAPPSNSDEIAPLHCNAPDCNGQIARYRISNGQSAGIGLIYNLIIRRQERPISAWGQNRPKIRCLRLVRFPQLRTLACLACRSVSYGAVELLFVRDRRATFLQWTFPVSREFGLETGSHLTASSASAFGLCIAISMSRSPTGRPKSVIPRNVVGRGHDPSR